MSTIMHLLVLGLILTLVRSLVDAQSSLTLLNVNITFVNNGTHTQFAVVSKLGNGLSLANSWLGVGLNSMPRMEGASVVMCKNFGPSTAVEHYFTIPDNVTYLDSTNPTIGITSASLTVDSNNNLVCKYTRANVNANSNYFNLNAASPYILAAYGPISNGTIKYHAARAYTNNLVQFSVMSSYQPINVNVNFNNNGTHTTFVLTSPLSNGISLTNSWLAFGFNTVPNMLNASEVVCKNFGASSSVQHYFNYPEVAYLDSTNPSIGISSASLSIDSNNNMICQFTRANANPNPYYFNLTANPSPYILTAFGTLSNGCNLL